ncbi:MAG: hypothetical protein ACPIOQ_39230 [Promethearchaeia archaeon]
MQGASVWALPEARQNPPQQAQSQCCLPATLPGGWGQEEGGTYGEGRRKEEDTGSRIISLKEDDIVASLSWSPVPPGPLRALTPSGASLWGSPQCAHPATTGVDRPDERTKVRPLRDMSMSPSRTRSAG